jgi:D-3-phosphoglycerate dehydrogenase
VPLANGHIRARLIPHARLVTIDDGPLSRHQRRRMRGDHCGFLELAPKRKTYLNPFKRLSACSGRQYPQSCAVPAADPRSRGYATGSPPLVILHQCSGIGQMVVNTKRVFYVKYLAHQSYLDTIAKRPDIRLDKLENDSTAAAVEPVLAVAHAYQIGSSRYEIAPHFHATAELIARIPNLLIVSANGAGYDTVDVKACTAAGVLVLNQAGGNREAVAEHVMGMMLTLSKRISESDRAIRRGDAIDRNSFVGDDVHGRTIGIVGLGHVGRRVAELARGLFAMRALAYDPYLSADETGERGAEKVELAQLLRQADYVSLNCPLTDETRGMIGAREFALMQPHAYFITPCRGHVHDETALLEALRAKRIAGAGLDVWSKEPPPHEHPLLQFDNVLASPHTAGITHQARVNMGRIAAEQLIEVLDGKPVSRVVNPEVWPLYAKRFERTLGFAPRE